MPKGRGKLDFQGSLIQLSFSRPPFLDTERPCAYNFREDSSFLNNIIAFAFDFVYVIYSISERLLKCVTTVDLKRSSNIQTYSKK